MSEIVKQQTHVVDTPSSIWVVDIPDGGTMARPLASYDMNGNSIDIDSWDFKNAQLHVAFGIDTHTGRLRYEWLEMGDSDNVTVNGHGGTINVTINQHNGGAACEPHNFPATEGGQD